MFQRNLGQAAIRRDLARSGAIEKPSRNRNALGEHTPRPGRDINGYRIDRPLAQV